MVKQTGRVAPAMASVDQPQCGLLGESGDIGQPLGSRGEFCLPSSSSPSLEVEENGLFWTDKNTGQPLGRGEFCLPCTSLAPALLGRTLSRRLPSGDVLQAEVTSCLSNLSRHLTSQTHTGNSIQFCDCDFSPNNEIFQHSNFL